MNLLMLQNKAVHAFRGYFFFFLTMFKYVLRSRSNGCFQDQVWQLSYSLMFPLILEYHTELPMSNSKGQDKIGLDCSVIV